ncbi:MAG: hypothetical protein GX657_10505 [Chloroflexi bacterium]|jgi:Tol biopolymer transport system component|nr:hypothetical protein [Chloroflexota bacterium]
MSTRSRSGKEALIYHDVVTGRRVLQLTNATCRSVHGYYDLPPWSRQTGQIAFSSLEAGATEGSVYVMERDGADITYLAHSRAMSANDGAMAQWSADGRRVYYKDREDGISLIAWVDVETGEADALPGDLRMICPTGNYNVYHTNSAYLPDHALLRDRERQGAFVMDLDSGESRLIVSVAECLESHPRRDEIKDWHLYIKHTKWSPDGKRLMFVFTNEIRYAGKFGEEPRVKDICVVDVDGGNLHNVGDFGHHPLWHPSGKEILANCKYPGRPNLSLVLIDADTGDRRLATTAIAGNGHPSFSPDGRYLVLDHVLGGEGSGSLNLVDVAANRVEHLLQLRVREHNHVGTHLHPAWSWDSRQVLIASDASGVSQLCVVDIA